jgi:hypothetical protein
MTIMLYQKMDENSALQKKLEQAQVQQMVFLSHMMSQQNNQTFQQTAPSQSTNGL